MILIDSIRFERELREMWQELHTHIPPYKKPISLSKIRTLLNKQPQVEAIPIEWIKNWMAKSENTYNREQVYEMLKEWEKENETNRR